MKKNILLIGCIAITAMITSCNKNTYVPYEELTVNTENEDTIENTTANEEENNVFDACKYSEVRLVSDNGKEVFILIDFMPRILDIENKSYRWLCTKLECDHSESDCVMQERKAWFRAYKDGYMYTKNDNLYYQKMNGEREVVFTNSYTSNLEKDMGWDTCMTFLFIDEDNLLIVGRNYLFTYNISGNRCGDIIEVADTYIFSSCYYDGIAYTCMSTGELYKANLDSGEVSYVLEQAYNPKFFEDRIYYCKWYKGVCSIYSNNTEFTDEKLFLENAGPMFNVCEEGIYYAKDKEVFLVNINGETEYSVDVSDWEYDYDRLPSKYQSDDVNRPNAETSSIAELHYVEGELIFCVNYKVYSKLNEGLYSVYYGVDENGEIYEFMER